MPSDLNANAVELTSLVAEILARGQTARFRTNGLSMAPFIRHDDWLVVTPLDARPIRRGDIVLFVAPDGLTAAHRVTRVRGDGPTQRITTQGDALIKSDGEMSIQHILGRVTTLERGTFRQRLDSGWPYRLARIWQALSPFSRWSYRGLLKLRSWITRPRL